MTEGFLGWFKVRDFIKTKVFTRFKIIRRRRIIEYRILYRVEDSRRRCLGMGGGVDAYICIACLRQGFAFAKQGN